MIQLIKVMCHKFCKGFVKSCFHPMEKFCGSYRRSCDFLSLGIDVTGLELCTFSEHVLKITQRIFEAVMKNPTVIMKSWNEEYENEKSPIRGINFVSRRVV